MPKIKRRAQPSQKRTDTIEIPPAKPYIREDGFANFQTGVGTSKDKRLGATFVADLLSYSECREIWRASDIAARVIETLPKEALARGFNINIDGEEKHDDLVARTMQLLDDVGAIEALEVALRYDRGFGGGALLLGAVDGNTMDQPLNVDAVQDLLYVTPLEPTELTPIRAYSDPEHPLYGRTSHYALTPTITTTGDPLNRTLPADVFEVHASRVIVMQGVKVGKDMSGTVGGVWCGDSVLVRVLRALADFDGAFASTGIVLSEHGAPVFAMKELAKLVNANRLDIVRARLSLVSRQMSAAQGAVIDTEEEYKRHAAPLNGLSEILDQVAMRLAAACEMPLSKLMGRQQGGLTSTGEGDNEQWLWNVETYQTRRVRPALRKLVEIAMAATGMQRPEKWSLGFPPLWSLSEKEVAEAHYTQASADVLYITNGVVSAEEVRRSLGQGGQYSLETSDDVDELTQGPLNDEDKEAIGMPPTGKPKPQANVAAPMLAVIQSAVRGEVSRESARAVLKVSFGVDDATANELLGPVDFKPTTSEPANDNSEAKPVGKAGAA